MNDPDAEELVRLTNELLKRAEVDVRIRAVNEIDASVFVAFVERLCDDPIPDVVYEPKTKADEMNNIKVILSMLSRSLGISLAHISAEEVVAGSFAAIRDLIEILSRIMNGDSFDASDTNDQALIDLANSLLEKSEMTLRVKDARGINSSFFVQLLTGLCREPISGFIVSPKTIKDEKQNVRLVLQILEDVLGVSLSHISPDDVVSGNGVVVKALLDIFSDFIDGILANESNAAENEKINEELLILTNRVLERLDLEKLVSKNRDINASLFVRLLEQLCNERLAGVIRDRKTADDDLHNVRIVMNSLQDSLNISLSHIRPEKVVEGDVETLERLLRIFAEIVEGSVSHFEAESDSKGGKEIDPSQDDREVVNLANSLLAKRDVDLRVRHLNEINASFFLKLLEDLCSDQIQGTIRHSQSADDEIHNMKLMISTLSDYLGISLSHINPKDILDGHLVAIKHLLEVFNNIAEVLQKKTAKISDESLFRLINRLLGKMKIAVKVKRIQDINSSLFVDIVQRLCDTTLTGIVRQPKRPEEEIQNIGIVLAALESSFRVSLSQISVESVAGSDRAAVRSLVKVLARVADEQERRLDSRRTSDDNLVTLANRVLEKFPGKITENIASVAEIDASYFRSLLERLCSEHITDFINQPKSRENDIHNMRVVVNTLSDVLMTPLSHIRPREVVLGDRRAIGHLLEVFYELPTDFDSFIRQRNSDNEMINQTNEMLERLHIDTKIRSLGDLNASVFVILFEGLCAEALPDIVRNPRTKQDEIHNIDEVIKTLSADILNMSLSHIRGQEIIEGDRTAIANLLEIFYGLMEFILEEIRDESRNENDLTGNEIDDPDLLRPDLIDRVLRSSILGRSTSINSPSDVNTSELVQLGESDENRGSGTEEQRSRGQMTENDSDRDAEIHRTSMKSSAITSHMTSHLTDHVTSDASTAFSVHHPLWSNGLGVSSRHSEFPGPVSPTSADDGTRRRQVSDPRQTDYSRSKSFETTRTDSSDIPYRNNERLGNSEFDAASEYREMRTSYSSQPSVTTLNAALPKSKYVSFDHSAPRENPPIKNLPKLDDRRSSAATSFNAEYYIHPKTYQDYLMKYYGRSDRRIADDASYLSDGCVDYDRSSDGSGSGSFARELESCRQRLNAKAKAVRFDDYLDDCATGPVGELRRRFKAEDRTVRLRKELLGKVYQDELFDRVKDSYCEAKKTSDLKEKEFKNQVFKPPPIARYRTKKYSAPKSVLLSRSRSGHRQPNRPHKRSASASPSVGYRAPVTSGSSNILPELLDEFPYLHLTSATLTNLYRRAAQQVDQLSRAEMDAQRRKTKAQEQIEDAERRQMALIDIMQKDLTHQQRMKDAKDRRLRQMSVKAKIREKRLQTARIRRYYDDFHVRQRSRMLKRRTKEELVFKNLFNDGLDIQKDRIREIKKYAKEQREQRTKRQKDELESLENFYRDQFMLLAESLESERSNTVIRDKAQTRVLEQLKQELRKKMEKEIRNFQQRLFQDEDDIYYREIDAERIKRELRLAQSYHSKV